VEIRLGQTRNRELTGSIRLPDGTTYATFRMSWPTLTYVVPANFGVLTGFYVETLADFAQHETDDGVVRIAVNGLGELSFRSPVSGCEGSGSLNPHGDGAVNLYDATLTIRNCTGAFQYLNGPLEGLATRAIDDFDFWGNWLVMWLSSPPGTDPEVALTMWGSREEGS